MSYCVFVAHLNAQRAGVLPPRASSMAHAHPGRAVDQVGSGFKICHPPPSSCHTSYKLKANPHLGVKQVGVLKIQLKYNHSMRRSA